MCTILSAGTQIDVCGTLHTHVKYTKKDPRHSREARTQSCASGATTSLTTGHTHTRVRRVS